MEDSAKLVTRIRRILLGAAAILGSVSVLVSILGFIYQRSHPLPIAVTSLLSDATRKYAQQTGRAKVLQQLCLSSTMTTLTVLAIGFGLIGRLWSVLWKKMPEANEYYRSLAFLACFFSCITLPVVVVDMITGISSGGLLAQLKSFMVANITPVAIALLSFFVMKKYGSRVFFPLLVAFLILKTIYSDMRIVLTLRAVSGGLKAPLKKAVYRLMVDHGANPDNAMLWQGPHGEDDARVRSGSFFGTFLIIFTNTFLQLPENSQLAMTAFELARSKYRIRIVNIVRDFIQEVGFWLVAFRVVLPNQAIFAAFGFPDESIAGSIAIAHTLSSIAKPVQSMLGNWLNQFLINKADAHVVSLGYGQAWSQQLLQGEFTRYDQNPLYSLLYSPVPTAKDRISHIEQLMSKR